MDEVYRQDCKWGEQNHDDEVWLAILMEEVGELAEAVLHKRFGGPAAEHVEAEAVQVAAVAMQMVWCLREFRAGDQSCATTPANELAGLLERHNRWRRGEDGAESTDPKQITAAIDTVVKILRGQPR